MTLYFCAIATFLKIHMHMSTHVYMYTVRRRARECILFDHCACAPDNSIVLVRTVLDLALVAQVRLQVEVAHQLAFN